MRESDAISPVDGRYAKEVGELREIFSERGLFRERIFVELSYLAALCKDNVFEGLPASIDIDPLMKLPSGWYDEVKELEARTGHDVKAVELWLRKYLKERELELLVPYIHIGLTSEDVNSIAYGRMVLKGICVLQRAYRELALTLARMGEEFSQTRMLARTHGLPAIPTTFGKELAVFAWRVAVELKEMAKVKPYGKLSGAVGSYNALYHLRPDFDWLSFAKRFIEEMGLAFVPATKQITLNEGISSLLHHLILLNLTVQELARDLWLYNMLGLIKFERKRIGSSTMPHKVNPVDLENAEGQVDVANALLRLLAYRTQTRLQRDLSDSTVRRMLGQAIAHSLIACKRVLKALKELSVDEERMLDELKEHPEVLSEAVQVSLRAQGDERGYERVFEGLERLDELTGQVRGKLGERLKGLKPENYIGLAPKIAREVAEKVKEMLRDTGS